MRADEALDAAVYPHLSAAGVLEAPVYQNAPPPQEVAYPLVLLGEIDELAPLTIADDPDREGSYAVLVMTDSEERASCLRLTGQIAEALSGRTLRVENWSITFDLTGTSVTLAGDGLGYNGVVTFHVIALSD